MSFTDPFRNPHEKVKCGQCPSMAELIDLTPVRDARGRISYVCPECYEREKKYQILR